MTPAPELTVAICTHNRPEMLAQLLARLVPQAERRSVWVKVVDSASDPAAARQVSALVAGHPFVHLIRLDRPGVSHARNAALDATSTPWLGFIDDDELPPADWIDRALDLCRRLPDDCAACDGDTLPRWPDGRNPPRLGLRWRKYLSLGEYPGEFDQSDDPHFLIGHSVVRVHAVRAVGGFDLRLGRDGRTLLSGEEALLVDLLVRSGWRVWHTDRLSIEHAIEPERITQVWARSRAYWEGVTRARVLRLTDPEAYRRLCRGVAVRRPALQLLAAILPDVREFDLRSAFAAGVSAERNGDHQPSLPAGPRDVASASLRTEGRARGDRPHRDASPMTGTPPQSLGA